MPLKPDIIELPADTIVKIDGPLKKGFIEPLLASSLYYQTWRETGQDAPTTEEFDTEKTAIYYRVDRLAGEDVIFGGGVISNDVGIDVYIRSEGADGKIKLST